ncbi:MAG: hypothetical protein CMD29_05400 [Flavobacteriales bacterium]|nr:hypothetical protein [Flavobacteriales bacterium]|tara:strand:- start:4326 stop:4922 length:597 start_codon:yes stop_codon:yes gene_type:complete
MNKINSESKLILKYIIRKKITPSKYQSKDWRKSQIWYQGGKKNECELYQRNLIETITNKKCLKTNERIHMDKNEIINESRPMKREDAFSWTEDFDGKQQFSENIILYYNLKMVCESGGGQTRTLREVSHFIRSQLEYNKKYIHHPKYFVNILDGNESSKLIEKFNYILNNEKYKYIKNFIFVGDMVSFFNWFHQLNVQ